MKRIIAFVLLGLLVYAGGFVIVYAAEDISVSESVPQFFSGNLHSGTIEGRIQKSIDKLGTKTYQDTLLGIPIGEKITQHIYVIPVGDSETPNYMLLAVTEPADIEAVENLTSEGFRFTGVAMEMERETKTELKNFLIDRPRLIGTENNPYSNEIAANNRITPYMIRVCEIGKADYTSLWVGIAMCAVGIGLAALLILKIVRERSGY